MCARMAERRRVSLVELRRRLKAHAHASPVDALAPSRTPPALSLAQIEAGGQGVAALRGPCARGALALGSTDGHVSLLDPRARALRGGAGRLLAHSGGFAALDAGGDLILTAGFSLRPGGDLSLERHIKASGLCGHQTLQAGRTQPACRLLHRARQHVGGGWAERGPASVRNSQRSLPAPPPPLAGRCLMCAWRRAC